jgi:hypothetical protein
MMGSRLHAWAWLAAVVFLGFHLSLAHLYDPPASGPCSIFRTNMRCFLNVPSRIESEDKIDLGSRKLDEVDVRINIYRPGGDLGLDFDICVST